MWLHDRKDRGGSRSGGYDIDWFAGARLSSPFLNTFILFYSNSFFSPLSKIYIYIYIHLIRFFLLLFFFSKRRLSFYNWVSTCVYVYTYNAHAWFDNRWLVNSWGAFSNEENRCIYVPNPFSLSSYLSNVVRRSPRCAVARYSVYPRSAVGG